MVNAVFWTSASAWLLEFVGWIPDLPSEAVVMTLLIFAERSITWPFRRRARPLSGMPSVPLSELMHMPAESHVYVRGRIRALEPMSTYLGEIDDAVYSHVELGNPKNRLETGSIRARRVETRDFLLVDDSGATVEIRMDQAEVELPRRKLYLNDDGVAKALLDQLQLPGPRPEHLQWATITEHWLADGDEIEVLGTVERVPDPRQEALPRDLPTRPVLISVHGRPLTVQLLPRR